jgi:thioredoxin reductase (NADPH)
MEAQKFDIIIMGAGPAGYQAAIHAARRKASVILLGKPAKSSAYSAHIENFCCLDGRPGSQLLDHARDQVEKIGVQVRDEDVTELDPVDSQYAVTVESGLTYQAPAVILATGITRNKLGLPEEKKFTGKGISYCVDCDGPLYKNQPLAITGCESAAGSGALTLLFYSQEVHLICEEFKMAPHLAEKIRQSAILVYEGRKVTELLEENGLLAGVLLDDGTRIKVNGLFVEKGAKGALGLAGKLGVMMDSETMSYIAVNKKQETNIPGIYAAGDICGPPWQVAKAVGEGCVAGLEAAAFVKDLPLQQQGREI